MCFQKVTNIWCINELQDQSFKIPDYQRPYSWSQEQVEQLLEDLIEAWQKNDGKYYLVGNIILYKNEKDKTYEIVDGQQRITTFALILKALNVEAKQLFSLKYSPLSIKSIKRNSEIIEDRLSKLYFQKESFKDFFLEKVIVTYVEAPMLDEAFLYFDSQNTRGKALARKDLLKVHHIRHMYMNNQYDEAKIVAKIWERDEKVDEQEARFIGDDLLQFLFEQILGIARKAARGELQAEELRNLDVYREFQSEGESQELNFYNQPPLFERFEYNLQENCITFIPRCAPFSGLYMLKNGVEYLPFEVLQSIDGGLYFFLFTQKYVKRLKELRKNEWFLLLDDVGGAGNGYLRKVYRAALMFYYDKFGKKGFDEFSAHLFLMLAYYRAKSGRVDVDGVQKFRWAQEKVFNPFTAILLKYKPEHIINAMKKYLLFYTDNEWKNELKGTKKEFYLAAGSDDGIKRKVDALMKEIWGFKYEPK